VCGQCQVAAYCSAQCVDIDWSRVHHAEHENGTEPANLVLGPQHPHWGSLWIGGIDALHDDAIMARIGAVVSVVHEERLAQCVLDHYVGERPALRVSIRDRPDEDIGVHFQRVGAFIDAHIRAGRNVLVHCMAGISRSATFVLYYMMRYRGFGTADEALGVLRKVRPRVQPNRGFWLSLQKTDHGAL
jgi:protein-tyrosine phosphatase